jgi:lantibiotic modifying enzyme
MKMKKHVIYSIFIVLLLFFNHILIASSKPSLIERKLNTNMTDQELFDIALEIAVGLLNSNITVDSMIKWPRILDNKPPEWLGNYYIYYYGYNWGVAGIADTLLQFYTEFGDETFLIAAEKAAFNGSQPYPGGGVYWYSAEERKTSYIGLKYGNVGCATFFLHLYKQTLNDTYLFYLNQSLLTLSKEAKTDSQMSHWGFSINSTEGVSDMLYGTSGVSNIFLEAGLALNNPEWIKIAIRGGKWLENISTSEFTNNDEYMAIPWSNFAPFNLSYYTGMASGNSGVGRYFISLFKGTSDNNWLENAKKVGNWLLQEKVNDTWINGGVGYATELPDPLNHSITGVDSGVAGIGSFFLDLYNETREKKYAIGALDAANWLIKNINTSDTGIKWQKVTTGIEDNDTYLTGFGSGAAGIGDFFSRMFEFFGCQQFQEVTLGVGDWLNSVRSDKYIFPVAKGTTQLTVDLTQYGHHLSYYDGSAGIALYFLNAAKRYNSTSLYPGIISCELVSDLYPTSKTEQSLFFHLEDLFYSFLAIISIGIVILAVIISTRAKKGKK